ncbi:hypothetical protein RFI_22081, partial [Reticulomyxa filosa]
ESTPIPLKLKDAKVSTVLYGVRPNIFFSRKTNLADLENEQHVISCFQNDNKWIHDPNPLNNRKYCQLFFAFSLKFKLYLAIALMILDFANSREYSLLIFTILNLRMTIIALYMGYLFHFYFNYLQIWSFFELNRTLDLLLVDSLLFLSYLWYEFKYIKYCGISIVVAANILYFINSIADNDGFSWEKICYSCLLINCGNLSMINSLYLVSKQQLCTGAETLFNRIQLHIERKEHTYIMNSLMPAPVTEQVLLKGETPIYGRDVTVGFVYFTFYDKLTTQIKDNSSCVEILHHIVINLDKELEQWEFDVLKIEHVGNAYLVCGGVMSPDQSFNHAEAERYLAKNNNQQKVIRLGLRFRRIVDKVNAKLHVHSELTMGIHSGPVVGTIIGTTQMFIF